MQRIVGTRRRTFVHALRIMVETHTYDLKLCHEQQDHLDRWRVL